MSSQKYNFNDKVVIVTGSSSGIGAATALQFARYGANVTITGRNQERLDKVAEEIQSLSGKEALTIVGDIGDEEFCEKLVVETVDKFGRIDILVNNAGIYSFGDNLKDDTVLSEFDQLIRINVRSVIKLTQLVIPQLEQNRGNVVNISSAASLKAYSLGYSASKAALDMVTKTSAAELGPKGIRVNSVNPGFVYTNIFDNLGNPSFFQDNEELLKTKFSSMNRIADSDEIANLIVFLASDDASNITGSIMLNDSGLMVK